MRVCLVIAPWRTATDAELMRLNRALNWLLACGWCPVFLPYALRDVLNDDQPGERETALNASAAFVRMVAAHRPARAFVIGDRITAGMDLDIRQWKAHRENAIQNAAILASALGIDDFEGKGSIEPRRLTWDRAIDLADNA